ncbi:hypothetical protein MTR67_052264 [Solanum verrucosum]|jgi:hypothetical protein
MYKQ